MRPSISNPRCLASFSRRSLSKPLALEIIASKVDLGFQRTVINKVVFKRQPSRDEIDLLKTASVALFVFGEATYTDIFGDGHTLPVRLAVGGPYGDIPADGKLAICEEGNTAT